MKTMAEMTEAIEEMRELLQHVVRQLDGHTQRIEEVKREIARVKDAQNEMLAGLALYERVHRLKETVVLEEKPPEIEESTWDSIQAYCRNCIRMVHIVEPRATFYDEHTVVEAKCRNCGTMVLRTLL